MALVLLCQPSPWWGNCCCHPILLGLLVGFGAITTTAILVEWKLGNRAMFVMRLMKHKAISASILTSFFLSGSFFLLLCYLPIYFQTTRGASATQSGVDNLPLVIFSLHFFGRLRALDFED
jgi:hypothetical protein